MHQVACHTVSLQCSAGNQNTIQVSYSLHFKPCKGLACGHQGFSQTCLLAATAQHLVPGSAWMHPWCQELCGTPGSWAVEIHSRVLGSCPESFPQVPQKVHQPQISIPHLVLVGSIPTVRDPGPGKQYLQGLEGNHKTDDWVGRGTGVQNRYQLWMIPLNISYFLSRRKKIIRANG